MQKKPHEKPTGRKNDKQQRQEKPGDEKTDKEPSIGDTDIAWKGYFQRINQADNQPTIAVFAKMVSTRVPKNTFHRTLGYTLRNLLLTLLHRWKNITSYVKIPLRQRYLRHHLKRLLRWMHSMALRTKLMTRTASHGSRRTSKPEQENHKNDPGLKATAAAAARPIMTSCLPGSSLNYSEIQRT